MAACLLMATLSVCAQTHEKDSLRVISLQEVEIISTRATGTTPVAFTNVSKEQLKKQNFGQDLPYLLSMIPSALQQVMQEPVSVIPPCAYAAQMARESMSPPTVFLSMMQKATPYSG